MGGRTSSPPDPSPAGRQVASGRSLQRICTGIPGLDPLVEGGFPSNRAILVSGEPGTGKTTFGMQFIAAGLAHGDAGAFVSVDEKPQHVIEDASRFGWDLQQAIARGQLAMLDASPYFTMTRDHSKNGFLLDSRQIASDLVQQVRAVNAQRVVIDSLTSLVPPDLTQGQVFDYLRSLILAIEDNMGCTVILTARSPVAADARGVCEAAEYLVSGIVELKLARIGRAYIRTLFAKKMRGTETKLAEYLFVISSGEGLRVLDEA